MMKRHTLVPHASHSWEAVIEGYISAGEASGLVGCDSVQIGPEWLFQFTRHNSRGELVWDVHVLH